MPCFPAPSGHLPKFQPRHTVSKLISTSLAIALSITASGFSAEAYKWSVQYIIDNSQSVQGLSQAKYPRRNRGLALSPDGRYLYAGYIHSWNGEGEVRKIAVDRPDRPDADYTTINVLPGPTAKAIATDDRGRVYITERRGVDIYDADLEELIERVVTPNCEGVAVVREGGKLVMVTSDREHGDVRRWAIEEDGDKITDVVPTGFDGTGSFHVPGSISLRGLRVDAAGNIWVCDYEAGKVFRVRKDGKDVKSVEVPTPVDLAFDGDRIFVTCGRKRVIEVLDKEMVRIGTLNVPWQELELSLYGNNQTGALCGIASVPGKGFYVANEGGQTPDQKSTYGRADDAADIIEEKVFRDIRGDDNEPILKATAVMTTAATR